jgi:predicted glycoside hydrolase/deacetylase ChbG (UPF0249 family)
VLVVNADDWGYDEATTAAIATAFEGGGITSTTAMVFMRDSERAAALAAEIAIPVGLHLNLMEPFSSPAVPPPIRSRQARVVGAYRRGMRQRWRPAGATLAAARQAVDDQLAEFRRLYGEPTHVDGHQHGHLALGALSALRRSGTGALRPSFTFRRGQKSIPNRSLRAGLNLWIGSRFRSADSFHSIRDLHPAFGGTGLSEAIESARARDVEIMVHPGNADELDLLMSAEWRTAIESSTLGTYEEVGRR